MPLKVCIALAFLLTLLAPTAHSGKERTSAEGFLSYNHARQLYVDDNSFSKTASGFYTRGLIEGIHICWSSDENWKERIELTECLSRFGWKQLVAMTHKYAEDHPELWNRGMTALTLGMLQSHCSDNPQ